MGSARLRLVTGVAALGLVTSAAACAKTRVWHERWELADASTAGAERTGTFGFSWTDTDHTRGEYGFTFTVAGTADPRASETWHVQGMFTAEQFSPDFCGHATWTAGSTCLAFTLWPRGDEPPGPIQAHLDQLG